MRDSHGNPFQREADPPPRSVIVGCASTGAKFTPRNHLPVGDDLMDKICSGVDIPATKGDVASEMGPLYSLGCRYYHYHARDHVSREQTTDNSVYKEVGHLVRDECPDMLLSFGASRNGPKVRSNVARLGEWERISQCGIPIVSGGAQFVTLQAAIELQVICDLERRGGAALAREYIESDGFKEQILTYAPSEKDHDLGLEASSTARGARYGASSPRVQLDVYRRAIGARRRLGLFQEVEWVQLARSAAMTRFAVEHPELRLGGSGQLNIVLLFGFSPRLPFPAQYRRFKEAVDAAKRLEYNIGDPAPRRAVTITVGAAVFPQRAAAHLREVDVGPFRGERMCALRRLAVYAAQPDSGVDVLRVGMEDTPYEVDADGTLRRTSNVRLVERAVRELRQNGADVVTDPERAATRLLPGGEGGQDGTVEAAGRPKELSPTPVGSR